MLLSFLLLSVVGPLSGVYGLPWNLPPNFRYRPEWDSLRVKWGLNIFSENNFRSLPRKVSDAHDARFALLRDECQEIEQAKREERRSRAKFAGRRYWKNNDPSVVLIYDVNGYVAGMQTAIPKKLLEKDGNIMNSIGVWKDDERVMMHFKSQDKSDKETRHRIRRQVQTSSMSPATSTATQGSKTSTSGLSTTPLSSSSATPGINAATLDPSSQSSGSSTATLGLSSPTPGSSTATPGLNTATPGLSTLNQGSSTATLDLSSPTPGSSTSPGVNTATQGVRTATLGPSTPTLGSSTQSTGQSGTPTLFTGIPTHSTGTPTHSTGTPTLFTGTPTMFTGTPAYSPGTPTPFTDTITLFPATSLPIPGSSTTFYETRSHVSGTHINTPETSFTHPQGGSSTKNPEFSKDQMEVLLKRPLLYPYVEEEGFLLFTVYFIEPERICNPERAQTVDEFEHFGTGSGFYIQNGTGIQSVIEIPRDEHKLQENHQWKAEKCFWTQGKIYSYNFHKDQDCRAQFPLLLNYNEGRLTGFAMLWKMDFSSPYLEHPDKGLLKFMFEKVPKCYNGIGRLTKLQVYFTNHYLSHRC